MRQYLPELRQSPLFDHISDEDVVRTLTCLNAQAILFERGRIILHQGSSARHFGVVLRGAAQVMQVDHQGNHTIITAVGPGELFAESFACAGCDALPASVVAIEDCEALMFEQARVITGCRNGCMAHSRLVTNLMRSLALKNITLNQKLSIITRRTTRDKLMAYFDAQRSRANTQRFVIPFDRQGLADYLGVERSAMSAELSKMKKDGLIDFKKNEFESLTPPERENRHA